jgi:hypothetical protein
VYIMTTVNDEATFTELCERVRWFSKQSTRSVKAFSIQCSLHRFLPVNGSWKAYTRPEVMHVFEWLRMQAIMPMYCIKMPSEYFGSPEIVEQIGVLMPHSCDPKHVAILFLSPECSFVGHVIRDDADAFTLCVSEAYMGGVPAGKEARAAVRHGDVQKRASVHNAFKDALVRVLRMSCSSMSVQWQPQDALIPGTEALLLMLHLDALVYGLEQPTKQNVYAVKCMLGVQYFHAASLLNLQLDEQNTLDRFNRIVEAPMSAVVLKRLGLHNLQ